MVVITDPQRFEARLFGEAGLLHESLPVPFLGGEKVPEADHLRCRRRRPWTWEVPNRLAAPARAGPRFPPGRAEPAGDRGRPAQGGGIRRCPALARRSSCPSRSEAPVGSP